MAQTQNKNESLQSNSSSQIFILFQILNATKRW